MRLLKIDVEGAEVGVLRGATSLLTRCEFVWLEVCQSFLSRFGSTEYELFDLLEGHRFSIYAATFSKAGYSFSPRDKENGLKNVNNSMYLAPKSPLNHVL